jgi:hypothetical protein
MHTRAFSVARKNCRLWPGGRLFLSGTRSQAQLRTQDPFDGSPNKSRESMPPRAILDMKLGGSGSELNGLGHIRVSSFLTRIVQQLRKLLWVVLDVWGRREAFS